MYMCIKKIESPVRSHCAFANGDRLDLLFLKTRKDKSDERLYVLTPYGEPYWRERKRRKNERKFQAESGFLLLIYCLILREKEPKASVVRRDQVFHEETQRSFLQDIVSRGILPYVWLTMHSTETCSRIDYILR